MVAGRPAMSAEINARREEGDLKENGGYHAAKDEQGKQEARIRQLTDLLRKATVGEPPTKVTNAATGTVITIRFAGRRRDREVPARFPRDRRDDGPDGLLPGVRARLGDHGREARRDGDLPGPQRQATSPSRSSASSRSSPDRRAGWTAARGGRRTPASSACTARPTCRPTPTGTTATTARSACGRCTSTTCPATGASDCRAPMEPIGLVEKSGKGWQVVHRCTACGHRQPNRLVRDGDGPRRPRPGALQLPWL